MKKLSKETVAEIKGRFKAGEKLKDLHKEYGLSYADILKLEERHWLENVEVGGDILNADDKTGDMAALAGLMKLMGADDLDMQTSLQLLHMRADALLSSPKVSATDLRSAAAAFNDLLKAQGQIGGGSGEDQKLIDSILDDSKRFDESKLVAIYQKQADDYAAGVREMLEGLRQEDAKNQEV